MSKKILAKSDGTPLVEHSTLVSQVAIEIAKQSLMEDNPDLLRAIELGALLHDIGKSQAAFQKKLSGTNAIDDQELIEK